MITKLSCLDFGTQPDSVHRLGPDPVSESEIGSDNNGLNLDVVLYDNE